MNLRVSRATPDSPEPVEPEATHRTPVRVMTFAGETIDRSRALAIETPVQVTFADIPFGVMMLTPSALEDFAYGFSLTEGIITQPDHVRGVTVSEIEGGLRLRIDLTGERLHAHLARKRALSGRTSCGLCGIEDLDALPRARAAAAPAPVIELDAIKRALGELDRFQPLNAETRAVHGAAWCSREGAVLHAREDVGRHNALDKLVGTLLRARVGPDSGFVLITSRASFEMVEKVGAFGARTLVAISAPTALALDRARALDLTLVGIARFDSVTIFHGAERLVPSKVPA